VVLVVQSGNSDLLHLENQEAVLALAAKLGADRRVQSVKGYPGLLDAAGALRRNIHTQVDLPEPLRPLAKDALSADGKTGLIILVTKQPPESEDVKGLVTELRKDAWKELGGTGISVQVGGATAMVADFDEEMLGSLLRVIPAVLALTFVALLILFRSLLIPLKAIALNLLTVLAAYGFLVYVFQDGIGAGLIGLDPPGGLNSLVVLMLFTILFGLSMDYEVFLLAHIGDEYRRSADNAASVAAGLQRTAGLITSAAFIMVCLFASFGFTRLTVTREFGLGLAFAVFLDATLIRILLVPALMELFGPANWWTPAWLKRML
jgi:putative drug exporter of the RND superfamily